MSRRVGLPNRPTRLGWGIVVVVVVVVALVLSALTGVLAPGRGASRRVTAQAPAVDPELLPTTLLSPTPTKYGYFGQSVAASGSLVVVGAMGENRVYIDNLTGGGLLTVPSPGGPAGGFGASVAVSGNTLVVGAPRQSVGGLPQVGSAYVFDLRSDALLTVLLPQYPIANGSFGSAVAIDGSTVAVGAPYAGSNGTAYAFNLTTNTSILLANPTPFATGGFGEFGISVAVSGNLVAVGADEGANSLYRNTGDVYVFSLLTGSLYARYTSPNPVFGGRFGWSVALQGTTLVVGAQYEEVGGSSLGAGRVYLVNLTSNAFTEIPNPDPTVFPHFGEAVAIQGNEVAVGAPFDVRGTSLAGGAYLYSVSNSTEIMANLSAPLNPYSGGFGGSVAVAGTEMVVGAPSTASDPYGGGIQSVGAAYVFGQVPLQFTSPGVLPGTAAGQSVSINGRGVTVTGAPLETAGALAGAGNVYVVPLDPRPHLAVQTLRSPTPTADGNFGYSVASLGNTLVVGAPGETAEGLPSAGHVYVFDLATGALRLTLSSAVPQASGLFGLSVATNGALVAVGAPLEAAGGHAEAGRVYLFNASTGALVTTLESSNPQYFGVFGFALSMSDSGLLVGAPFENITSNGSAGRAYLFSLPTGAPLATLSSRFVQTGGEFGYSVAMAGPVAVVGAPYENVSRVASAGRAYEYTSAGSYLRSFVSANETTGGDFGFAVTTNGGAVAVGAPYESAVDLAGAGNVYFFNGHTGTPAGRLNSPDAGPSGNFGASISLGPARLVAGAPGETADGYLGGGHAYFFCLGALAAAGL